MRKRLVLLGLLLGVVSLLMSTAGVAGACGGARGADWREVDATLWLDPYYSPGAPAWDWITPLGKKSTVSLSQYQDPWTDSLDGRFKVLSIFSGGMDGWFGDEEAAGKVTAHLASILDVSLTPEGGTEQGVIKGDVSVDFSLDGTNAIYGKIVGQVDLVMGPVPDPVYDYPLHPLAGGDVRLAFIVTGGTGEWEGANGILKIEGDPVARATVQGKIKVAPVTAKH